MLKAQYTKQSVYLFYECMNRQDDYQVKTTLSR